MGKCQTHRIESNNGETSYVKVWLGYILFYNSNDSANDVIFLFHHTIFCRSDYYARGRICIENNLSGRRVNICSLFSFK